MNLASWFMSFFAIHKANYKLSSIKIIYFQTETLPLFATLF
jgi:hypothetical protein